MKLDDSFKAIKQQAEQLKCGVGRAETQAEQLHRDADKVVSGSATEAEAQAEQRLTD